ncbi:MAG: hypothetical protein HOP15_03220 [Planctomycetes bacterium]|nr:hypothetical protein [Planctomycetota bacterium]
MNGSDGYSLLNPDDPRNPTTKTDNDGAFKLEGLGFGGRIRISAGRVGGVSEQSVDIDVPNSQVVLTLTTLFVAALDIHAGNEVAGTLKPTVDPGPRLQVLDDEAVRLPLELGPICGVGQLEWDPLRPVFLFRRRTPAERLGPLFYDWEVPGYEPLHVQFEAIPFSGSIVVVDAPLRPSGVAMGTLTVSIDGPEFVRRALERGVVHLHDTANNQNIKSELSRARPLGPIPVGVYEMRIHDQLGFGSILPVASEAIRVSTSGSEVRVDAQAWGVLEFEVVPEGGGDARPNSHAKVLVARLAEQEYELAKSLLDLGPSAASLTTVALPAGEYAVAPRSPLLVADPGYEVADPPDWSLPVHVPAGGKARVVLQRLSR